jgi:hypothetical protein
LGPQGEGWHGFWGAAGGIGVGTAKWRKKMKARVRTVL